MTACSNCGGSGVYECADCTYAMLHDCPACGGEPCLCGTDFTCLARHNIPTLFESSTRPSGDAHPTSSDGSLIAPTGLEETRIDAPRPGGCAAAGAGGGR